MRSEEEDEEKKRRENKNTESLYCNGLHETVIESKKSYSSASFFGGREGL